MTKMATTPIHGKNPPKIFSRAKGHMAVWLGILHLVFKAIIVCSTDDPRMTFMPRSNLVSCHFVHFVVHITCICIQLDKNPVYKTMQLFIIFL